MNNTIRIMTQKDKSAVLEMMRVFYTSPAVFTNGSEEIFLSDIENCINDESSDENPSNEKARMILEKRRKARNKLIKNNQVNTLHIPEIVNIVSVGMNLPISEVMQYSIYQLICEFNRLISKENYETSISALIHGANKNDLDLKHWAEKN